VLHDRRSRTTTLAALALAGVLLAPPTAHAEAEDSGPLSKFFFGITAAVCTLVYTPLKITYAVTSIPMSGLVYMWSVGNTEMTERVLRSGTQGNWMVTPEHLRGQRSLTFVGDANEGPDPDAPQPRRR
jgi:hypothetical protein